MSLRHRFVDVGEVQLHVVEAGPADGPAVLLLHGFPEFWYGWRHQLEVLGAAGFRVLAPDQRGYNLSDKPRDIGAYRIDRLVEDATGLLEALGLESASLCGHDWGGAVAWWSAATRPDRFPKVAILNMPHPLVMRRFLKTDKAQRRRSWYIFFFQLPWLPEHRYRRRNFELGVRAVQGTARRGSFSDEDMDVYRKAWSQPGAMRATINWYRAAMRHAPKVSGDLRISQPMMLLWGVRDAFLDHRQVAPSLERCDNAVLHEFPDATHWLQHDEPETVSRLLQEFFEA